jgi:hypothetical protein
MKFIKIAFFVIGAAALAWTGMYLHWHFKIVGAVQSIATQSAPAIAGGADVTKHESFEVLSAAGCRSLPYLANAMGSANNGEMMGDAFLRILTASAPSAATHPEVKAHLQFVEENRIFTVDTGARRQEKVERFRAWWAENGERYHQSWRVWSSKCASD